MKTAPTTTVVSMKKMTVSSFCTSCCYLLLAVSSQNVGAFTSPQRAVVRQQLKQEEGGQGQQQGQQQQQKGQQRRRMLFVPRALPQPTSSSSTIANNKEQEQSSSFSSSLSSDFGSAFAQPSNPYELLGIEEGQLALGVDPSDFYRYIGTREDLIEKTMEDIPSFTRATAEAEVDKFLLDQEAINFYISFQKKLEEEPDFVVPDSEEDEGLFSFRNLVFVYIGYVGFQSVPQYFRRWVADQEATGTWHGTNIPLIDDWIAKTAPAAAAARAAAEAAAQQTDLSSAASDAAASVIDSAANILDVTASSGLQP